MAKVAVSRPRAASPAHGSCQARPRRPSRGPTAGEGLLAWAPWGGVGGSAYSPCGSSLAWLAALTGSAGEGHDVP